MGDVTTTIHSLLRTYPLYLIAPMSRDEENKALHEPVPETGKDGKNRAQRIGAK